MDTSSLPTNSQTPTSSQLYVLLVEDDLIVQLVHKKHLINFGCRVDVANNAKEALEMAAAHKYSVIFMDVGLPGMSGIEVTAEIRNREERLIKHTPIIGLTGYTNDETQKECIAAGMDDVVTKPIEEKRLGELLKQFC